MWGHVVLCAVWCYLVTCVIMWGGVLRGEVCHYVGFGVMWSRVLLCGVGCYVGICVIMWGGCYVVTCGIMLHMVLCEDVWYYVAYGIMWGRVVLCSVWHYMRTCGIKWGVMWGMCDIMRGAVLCSDVWCYVGISYIDKLYIWHWYLSISWLSLIKDNRKIPSAQTSNLIVSDSAFDHVFDRPILIWIFSLQCSQYPWSS